MSVVIYCIICVTTIVCVFIASNANISIDIKHRYPQDQESKIITEEEIEKAYKENPKDNVTLPDMNTILNTIDDALGGVDYGTGK